MSKEAIIIPQHLQLYINQCLDDRELLALRAIPVKVFESIINLRDYFDFERREFRKYKDQILNVENIKCLSKQEIAHYKKVRSSNLDKYFPDLLSQPTQSTAAAAAENQPPDYQKLVDFLRASRRAERDASASLSVGHSVVSDESLAACTSVTQDISGSSREQRIMPALTRIKSPKKDKKMKIDAPSTSQATLTAGAAITLSQKQPPAITTLFRGTLPTSTSTTSINASTPRSDEKTPLLQRHPGNKQC